LAIAGASIRRLVVGATVAAAHLLLLAVVLALRPPVAVMDDRPDDLARIRLIFIEQRRPPPAQRPPVVANPRPDARTARKTERAEPAQAIAAEAHPVRPRIDWADEAARVGRQAAVAAQSKRPDCNDGDRRGSMLPKCTKANDHFEWHPEPKAVEFSGLIPYVHLGKRCVLGLGFFGCAVGKLPDANGRLFEDMRDPSEPTSSAPDQKP
jgi:hypothetical protein